MTDTLPDTKYAFWALVVTQLFTFLGVVAGLVKAWIDSQVIQKQNMQQLAKQDVTIAQQSQIHDELNGAKALAIAAATAAGVDKGKLIGHSEEQERIKIKVAAENQAARDASQDRQNEIRGEKT